MEGRSCRWSVVTLAAAIACVLSGVAGATNGYFKQGYGTQNKAMGGVGMALSLDAYAPGTNAAGIAGMESRVDASLAYFRPERSFDVSALESSPGEGSFPLPPGRVDSDREDFFIPSFGLVRQIDAERSWGIAVLANGGLNTDYPAITNPLCAQSPQAPANTGVFCGGSAGFNLDQILIIPTYAQRFADGRLRLGLSPIVSYQRFKAKGIAAFGDFSQAPAHLSDRGTDTAFGYGIQFGFQADLSPTVSVGANYRSKIRSEDMNDYRGLLVDGGSLDIPETFGIGIAVELSPRVTVAADYERINYSGVDAIGNPFDNLLASFPPDSDPEARLGGGRGPGFGWRDINIWKLGLQIEGGSGWTWRVGYNRGQNPVSPSEVLFNILAPAVVKDHYTAGFSKVLTPQSDLHVAAMATSSNSVRGPNPLADQSIRIEMQQFALEVGYSHRF
ncbi:hypothetical protein [Thioalkalivibrio sp.]|uniref:OmpP1/FadL family transporter n=1 Tax=Thioalkalivibrio sp. TaxID=2093813 RepID=UPI0012D582F3|nr:hypothetical protein [Thioalkalivibrio sp.]TVP77943.1 MAG: hypothetical protein EA346_12125 [Thioalkalivibrio sp.]